MDIVTSSGISLLLLLLLNSALENNYPLLLRHDII